MKKKIVHWKKLKVKFKHFWNETFGGMGMARDRTTKTRARHFIDKLKHFSWQLEMDIGNCQTSIRFFFIHFNSDIQQ